MDCNLRESKKIVKAIPSPIYMKGVIKTANDSEGTRSVAVSTTGCSPVLFVRFA